MSIVAVVAVAVVVAVVGGLPGLSLHNKLVRVVELELLSSVGWSCYPGRCR
jgi:hypothetical protein